MTNTNAAPFPVTFVRDGETDIYDGTGPARHVTLRLFQIEEDVIVSLQGKAYRAAWLTVFSDGTADVFFVRRTQLGADFKNGTGVFESLKSLREAATGTEGVQHSYGSSRTELVDRIDATVAQLEQAKHAEAKAALAERFPIGARARNINTGLRFWITGHEIARDGEEIITVDYRDGSAEAAGSAATAVLDPEPASAPDFPALDGRPVTQAHADKCARVGHAKHKRNGVNTGVCPRCGEVTDPEPESLVDTFDVEATDTADPASGDYLGEAEQLGDLGVVVNEVIRLRKRVAELEAEVAQPTGNALHAFAEETAIERLRAAARDLLALLDGTGVYRDERIGHAADRLDQLANPAAVALSGPLTAAQFIAQAGPLSTQVASNDAELCMTDEHWQRYPDTARTTEHVAAHLAELLADSL